MKFEVDKIEYVETYRGYKILINHNLNIYHNMKDNTDIIYWICKLMQGIRGKNITDVKKYIDCVLVCEEF